MMNAVPPHVVSDHRDRREWPIFVLGCHRSGTTLLRYLLDAHPDLACPPESKFLAGLHAFFHYSQALQGLESMGCSQRLVLAEIRRFAAEMFATYARQQGKTRWVDKTPNYYRILDFIEQVFDGRILYVCLHRHPLDTVASLEDVRDFAVEGPDDPEIAAAIRQYGRGRAAWAAYWRKVNGVLTTFCNRRRQRCLALRYEDLVSRPDTELRAILDFIGAPWVDGLVAAAFTRTPTPGYQDWKVRSTGAVHARSVGRWRGWDRSDVAQVWSVAGRVAGALGYEPPTVPYPEDAGRSSTQQCSGGRS